MNVKVVIPSARASNLIQCVESIWAADCILSMRSNRRDSTIVVDDGARDEVTDTMPITWVDGMKPFIFARNANLGIEAAGDADVILMNDDTTLMTTFGFSHWAEAMQERRDTVCSAAIVGTVCNPRQQVQSTNTFRPEPKHLAFVCVYLPRPVLDRVGPLDERFSAYGYEDFDFCRRAREAGCRLATWDGCVVDHSGHSTFRSSTEWPSLLMQGRQIYLDKWEAG